MNEAGVGMLKEKCPPNHHYTQRKTSGHIRCGRKASVRTKMDHWYMLGTRVYTGSALTKSLRFAYAHCSDVDLQAQRRVVLWKVQEQKIHVSYHVKTLDAYMSI